MSGHGVTATDHIPKCRGRITTTSSMQQQQQQQHARTSADRSDFNRNTTLVMSVPYVHPTSDDVHDGAEKTSRPLRRRRVDETTLSILLSVSKFNRAGNSSATAPSSIQ